MQIYYCQCNCT